MAFTSTQTAAIRTYLGYPSVYKDANPRLESAFAVVALDSDVVAQVVALLASIANVFAQIEGTALEVAGLKSLDRGAVEWYGDKGSTTTASAMGSIGRMYVSRLSGIFGVPIATDVFGKYGYQGDGWKGNNGNSAPGGSW